MRIEIELTPKQMEFDRAIEKYPVVLYGGAKGGGKSHGLRNIMLKRRLMYPRSIGYLFRKSYPELEANHISPLFEQFPALREYYRESRKTLRLPNGSQLRFAVCSKQSDLKKYQGREMHDLAIEEAGDWLFEDFEELQSCNRSSLPGVPARTILTANPGGLGHKWLKRLFVTREFEAGEDSNDYHFIPARVSDNPALLAADPRYEKRLAAIKNETLRRAFLHGDWDITAGQFFSEFRRDLHVVAPFKIPLHWNWGGSYDYGFNHPAAWLFYAMDSDGNVYATHEIIKGHLRIDEQAALVHEHNNYLIRTGQKKPGMPVFEAGHDCWTTGRGGGPSIAEDFIKRGIVLRQANIARVQGANQLRNYLAFEEDEEGRVLWGPRLRFFNTCRYTIDCITRMTHNPYDVEDVEKVDSVDSDPGTGDDPYDSVRYFIMSRPQISQPALKDPKDKYQRTQRRRASWQTV